MTKEEIEKLIINVLHKHAIDSPSLGRIALLEVSFDDVANDIREALRHSLAQGGEECKHIRTEYSSHGERYQCLDCKEWLNI